MCDSAIAPTAARSEKARMRGENIFGELGSEVGRVVDRLVEMSSDCCLSSFARFQILFIPFVLSAQQAISSSTSG